MKQKDQLSAFKAKQELIAKRTEIVKKDNRLVLIASAVAIVLAAVSQAIYFNFGPGASQNNEALPTETEAAAPENSDQVPSPDLAEGRTWVGSMNLNDAQIGFELDGALAPQAVANFVSLANSGFYEGISCHRLTTKEYGIEVLQCGDPNGDGSGGPGYNWGPIENAPADDIYKEGVLAMARQGSNGSSMGSQFFIVYADSQIPSDSAGGYTVFGKVTSGLDAVKAIAEKGTEDGSGNGRPLEPVTMTSVAVE
jgi:peptidyl-prolyl cis-trans isomerase B (cyclophilin B)